MKTTLDLPAELMRIIKVRAAEDNLKLKDLECAHPAPPGEELTPDRVAEILAEGEISDLGIVR